VPVVWATFIIFRPARSKWLLVGRDEIWLYHYDPETNQQSMEWRHSGSPSPKLFRVQKSAEKFLASNFWDQDGIQRAKLSTRSITHLCWCNLRTFWRKNVTGISPRGSCSYTKIPLLTGHLQPRRNWRTLASSFLNTSPNLRIWPRRTTSCSLDWKRNWKVAIFLPTLRSLLPRRLGLTDNVLIFFQLLAKFRATGLRSVLSFIGSRLNKSRDW